MHLDWQALQYFHKTAEKGSILHASEALNISATTLRRTLTQIEKTIGKSLFRRTHRGIVLTDRGRLLLDQTSKMNDIAIATNPNNVGWENALPECRVTCPEVLYRTVFPAATIELLDDIREINLVIIPDDDVLNLNDDEADISIRTIRPSQETFVANRLGSMSFGVYAPKTLTNDPAELSRNPLVLPRRNRGALDNLAATQSQIINQFKRQISVPSMGYTKILLESGNCIGVMPISDETETSDLVQLEVEFSLPDIDFWICRKRLVDELPIRKKVYTNLRKILSGKLAP